MVAVASRPSSFGGDRLAVIARIEDTHFWFQGRRELVNAFVRGRVGTGRVVLDAGCGTGSMLAELHRLGARAVGIDSLPEAVEAARATAPDAVVELADAAALPFAAESFDGVLALDVLEHVDDRAALAEAARVLRPAGFLVLTVPAWPRLWSRRDELAGHLRRYDRKRLRARLGEAGFVVERLTYYQLTLLPLFALARILGRFRPELVEREERVPPGVNRALAAVNRLEGRLAARVSLPIGSSLAALAIKP